LNILWLLVGALVGVDQVAAAAPVGLEQPLAFRSLLVQQSQ
jgi:hypothetical protein